MKSTLWPDLPGYSAITAPLPAGAQQCAIRGIGGEGINVLLFPNGFFSVFNVVGPVSESALLALGRWVFAHVRPLPVIGEDSAETSRRAVMAHTVRGVRQSARVFILPDRTMPLAWVVFEESSADDDIMLGVARILIHEIQ